MTLCLGAEPKTVNGTRRYDYCRAGFEAVLAIVEIYRGRALGDKHQLRQQRVPMGLDLPKILAAARLNASMCRASVCKNAAERSPYREKLGTLRRGNDKDVCRFSN